MSPGSEGDVVPQLERMGPGSRARTTKNFASRRVTANSKGDRSPSRRYRWNRELEAKARALAGLKGYTTNLPDPTPELVIGSCHQLWRIEKSFRMSKHDLKARPVYHHKRESIDAHLTVVFAALAITRLIEDRTSWSIKRFVRTARRYRTIQIRAGQQILTAEDPLPPDLRDALALITRSGDAREVRASIVMSARRVHSRGSEL
jgi:hypothetical protein